MRSAGSPPAHGGRFTLALFLVRHRLTRCGDRRRRRRRRRTVGGRLGGEFGFGTRPGALVRRLHRQEPQPVADRTTVGRVTVAGRGRQMGPQQGPYLVPRGARGIRSSRHGAHLPCSRGTRTPPGRQDGPPAHGTGRCRSGDGKTAGKGGRGEEGRGRTGKGRRTANGPSPLGTRAVARAVLTGFEPAASTLTGWRALQTAPQDLETTVGSPSDLRAARRDSTAAQGH